MVEVANKIIYFVIISPMYEKFKKENKDVTNAIPMAYLPEQITTYPTGKPAVVERPLDKFKWSTITSPSVWAGAVASAPNYSSKKK